MVAFYFILSINVVHCYFFCFCKLYSNLLPCFLTPVLSPACNENESHLTLDGVRFHTRHRFFFNIDNSVNNKIKLQLVKMTQMTLSISWKACVKLEAESSCPFGYHPSLSLSRQCHDEGVYSNLVMSFGTL